MLKHLFSYIRYFPPFVPRLEAEPWFLPPGTVPPQKSQLVCKAQLAKIADPRRQTRAESSGNCAGKLLVRRLLAGGNATLDNLMVPTTVFTPLDYAAFGLNEKEALQQLARNRGSKFTTRVIRRSSGCLAAFLSQGVCFCRAVVIEETNSARPSFTCASNAQRRSCKGSQW